MKKLILLLSGVYMSFSAMAQLPVSTTPENRRALLEEFTGINCTYCPAGHVIASNLKNANGANFWVMNVHVGSFSTPGAGQPDFRTTFGTGLVNQAALTGYPAGTINRHLFAGLGQNAGTAMGRGNWSNATTQIRAIAAYVNVAVEAQVDEQSRQLRVIVQHHFTANGTTTNKLNVALLQNNVEGPQTGAQTYNPGNIQPTGKYLHQHMLRHFITGQWGTAITNTAAGTTTTDTLYYTIPASLNNIAYDLGNLEVVAFITDGQQEVINANGSDVNVVNFATNLDAALNAIKTVNPYCPGPGSETLWVRMKNNGGTTITSATINISANGTTPTPYNWTGSLAYGQSAYVNLPTYNFTVLPSNTIDVTITNVNGGADQVSTNNTQSTSFTQAVETTNNNITVRVTLDGYGSETSWSLKNSANSTVASGGPYTDAGANGAYPQPDINLTLPNDCYTLQVNDSYGDGMCCAYGNGNIQVFANSVLIPGISSSTFTSLDLKKFTVNVATAVEEINNQAIQVYPNPAGSECTISFQNTVESALIELVDLQGRVILSQNVNQVNAHTMNTSNLANGVYLVVVTSEGSVSTQKLSILK